MERKTLVEYSVAIKLHFVELVKMLASDPPTDPEVLEAKAALAAARYVQAALEDDDSDDASDNRCAAEDEAIEALVAANEDRNA